MRKQTKIAAIVSAAALLAIGASMTSFAATGWQEEDGTWVYYNRAGEKVANSWEYSGDNRFYLDDAGNMATDSLIEDNDDYYYVDANGAMVRNRWVAIDNESAGEDNQPDVWWYYFQANGKAYKNTHATGTIFKRVINGKTYCFDEDGKMQYGWVKKDDGVTDYDDNAYQEAEYYFGDENDGAMSIGWREIALSDVADAEDEQPGDSYWDSDQVRWFYFKASGAKQTSSTNKTINGRKYGFDQYGRMIADWHNNSLGAATYQNASRRGSSNNATATATAAYAKDFMYFSSPEDGARFTKGWFKVVPGYYLNYADYDNGTDRWYYADGNGNLYAGQIKTIKGKKYAFDLKGGMIYGLALLRTDGSTIYEYADDENKYDSQDKFMETARNMSSDWAFYYFSDNEDKDGSMKTGTQKISLDGESFSFNFKKGGTKKGQGVTGMSEKKYYLGGMLLTADADNKIEVVNKTTLEKITVSKLISDLGLTGVDASKKIGQANKGDVIYTNTGVDTDGANLTALTGNYVVVNVSGTVVKSGSKVDGDGFKVVLDGNNNIKQIIATN
ncbi:cell wall-binding protein [Stomatobaculum longum]|uniref:cell wall-binding protein n=1 Tax=Stomatobaculum longum TaxID=796942 RepID=UPI0028054C4C|nr:cell wall-binding protein [Stomatobaculum longum]